MNKPAKLFAILQRAKWSAWRDKSASLLRWMFTISENSLWPFVCMIHYIRQVNGVNWRDIMWCFIFLPSVVPSVSTQNLLAKLTQLEIRTRDLSVACIDHGAWSQHDYHYSDYTTVTIRDNGVYKSLNTRPTTSEQKQNNDFYYKGSQ